MNIIISHNHTGDVVSAERREEIIAARVDQGDDQSGGWILQRRGCVTASSFSDIVKHRAATANTLLVIRMVHKVTREMAAIRYGHVNEPHVRLLNGEYLRTKCHPNSSVEKTSFHIDIELWIIIRTFKY